MTHSNYTFRDLRTEVTSLKKWIRKTHKDDRVYFDEPVLHISEHGNVSLQVAYTLSSKPGAEQFAGVGI